MTQPEHPGGEPQERPQRPLHPPPVRPGGVGPGDRVVCFGDSITRLGFCPDAADCSTREGWVTKLRRDLAGRSGGRAPEFVSAGVGGDTVIDLLARAGPDVIARRPTVVILMVGLNDTWRYARDPGRVPNGAPSHVPAALYEASLARLLRALRPDPESGPRVLLATPPLLGEDPDKAEGPGADALNRRLNEYCAAVRRLAAREGVELVDVRRAFLDYERAHNRAGAHHGVLTLPDGVHLNDAGQRLLADRVRDALLGPAARRHDEKTKLHKDMKT